jgi:hypothetical protein
MTQENSKPIAIVFPRRRRAARCSPPLTAELASKAKTMVVRLGLAQHVAAANLGVNPGRINDVILGRIFPDAPFAPLNTIE